MTSLRRVLALFAVLAVLMLTACGDTGGDTTADGPQTTDGSTTTAPTTTDTDGSGTSADTLRIAMAEVTSNLDPATYNVPANYVLIGGAVGYLVNHPYRDFPYPELYEGNVPVPDPSQYVPELATDWELSEDGLALTMNLRQGVRSPYGNELTSADVVWVAERNVALGTVGAFGMTVANIDKENPVTAEGDYTVVWHLTSPSPLLEKILAWSWFAPIDSTEAKAHATEEDPWAVAWLTENTAFFGAYTVTEFTPGQSVTLSVNPNYWGEAPAIETIVFQTVPDAGSRQQLVQRGEVDLVPDIPRSQLVSLEDAGGVQVIYGPATRFSYVQYNVSVEPLGNELVRQAISYAIPYDTILEDAYRGTALPAKTVGTWLPDADPGSSPYVFDLEKAAALLEQAGYGAGFEIDLTYSLANPGPENEQAAVLIADSLGDIGITVNLQRPSSEATFTSTYREGEFEMAIAGLSPGAPDMGYALFAMAHSAGYQNFGGFSDEAFDEASLTAMNAIDAAIRQDALDRGIALYNELMPATPIADPLVGIVASPAFGNLRLGVWGFPDWKYATIESE